MIVVMTLSATEAATGLQFWQPLWLNGMAMIMSFWPMRPASAGADYSVRRLARLAEPMSFPLTAGPDGAGPRPDWIAVDHHDSGLPGGWFADRHGRRALYLTFSAGTAQVWPAKMR